MISLICGILKSYTNREWNGGYRNQGQRNYGDNGQRLQTFNYIISSGDLRKNMLTIVKYTILYT